MAWFDDVSTGTWASLGGVAADVFAGVSKAVQTKKEAGRQSAESMRVAQENAKLARADAATALKAAAELRNQTERNLQIEYEKIDRTVAAQKEGYANSGVVVSAGSAAQIQAETARQGKINTAIIYHNGMSEVDRQRDLAKKYKQSAVNLLNDGAYTGYLLESTAAVNVGNIVAATGAKVTKSVYDIGKSSGWWGTPTTKTTPKYAGVGTYGVKAGDKNYH